MRARAGLRRAGRGRRTKDDAPEGERRAWREMRRRQSSCRIVVEHANAEMRHWRPLQRSTALTVAPNPVTAVLAIGTGVVYAGCLIWDNREVIGDGIEKAADWVGDKASDIGDGIAVRAKKLGSALNPFD